MSLPTANSDDPLAPFPTILLTARTIISHILAQPRHVKAYEVLSIPLLEHLMDLFVHVNLVDQRMDDLERQFGLGIVDENELKKRQDKERETKDKVFSWTMLIKGIYCSSLLTHLTSTSDSSTNSSSSDALQSFSRTIDHLFHFPISSPQNGVSSRTNGKPQDQGSAEEERLYRRWLGVEERAASGTYCKKFRDALEDWKSSGRCEPFRFPSLRRTAECVLNYIETVEKRYQAFDIPHTFSHNPTENPNSSARNLTDPSSKKPTDINVSLGRGVAPPLTPSSTASPQKGKTSGPSREGRREPSTSFIPDARGLKIEQPVVHGGPSTNGKGKGKEVDRGQDGQGIGVSSSPMMSARAEGDADRARSLRKSLNGGREEGVRGSQGSGRNGNRDVGGSNGAAGRHAHFDQVRDDRDEAGEMQLDIIAKQESQMVDNRQRSVSVRQQPPIRYDTDPRQSRYSSRGPFIASLQYRAPRASLPSHLGPAPSPTLSRSRAGSVRERSASVRLPHFPAGTILRVNDQGIAEVLSAADGQQYGRDGEQPYYEQDGYHQASPRGYVDSGRGRATHSMKPEPDDGWNDGEDLDELEAEDDEGYSQTEEEMGRVDSAPGHFPPPVGQRWILVPDDQPDNGSVAGRSSVVRQQDRRYERPSVPPSRDSDRQRVSPPRREYRSGTAPRQGERGIPVDNWRGSVQPTGLRYVTPIPGSQGSNRDPRRRHTEHVRPEQRMSVARPSVETNGRALPSGRRRQAYSLGGASDNGPRLQPTEDDASERLDDDGSYAEQRMDTAPPPDRRSTQVVFRPAANSLAQRHVAQGSNDSRPNQFTGIDRSPLTTTVPMSAATASTQFSHQSSSPSLKRHRPFENHQILRHPQNAKRARTNGLSTGRPEFQLADAGKDRQMADDAVAAATRAERQRDIEMQDKEQRAVAKQNSELFMPESDDDE